MVLYGVGSFVCVCVTTMYETSSMHRLIQTNVNNITEIMSEMVE